MKRLFTLLVILVAFSGIGIAADITGKWDFEVKLDAGTGNPTFTFKQDGEKVSGTYQGQLGEAAVTGVVKGNEIKFTFKVSQGGESMTATYEGTIDGATMKGKADYSGLASGTWTAKKAN